MIAVENGIQLNTTGYTLNGYFYLAVTLPISPSGKGGEPKETYSG